jgi:hypothetical protein
MHLALHHRRADRCGGRALKDSEANMAFSVVPWHGFLWQHDADGHGVGVNHDASQAPQRRQDLSPTYLETGAIYAIRTRAFLEQPAAASCTPPCRWPWRGWPRRSTPSRI